MDSDSQDRPAGKVTVLVPESRVGVLWNGESQWPRGGDRLQCDLGRAGFPTQSGTRTHVLSLNKYF